MAKRFSILLVFILLNSVLFAGNLKAYFSYSTFYSPQTGPYIETYLSVIGNSLSYQKNENGMYQSNIDITIIFKKQGKIENYKKYNLLSPEINDTISGFKNFLDQQRYSLPSGNYEMELSMSDYRNKDNPFSTSQFVEINYPEDKISISDIQLLESYKKAETPNVLTKSGYDLVPYVSNYYPGNLNKIVFYAEIYNTDKVLGIGEKYLLNFYIESQEIGGAVENNTGFLRQTANAANVLLSEFNISELPSGNYNLTIEVKNKNNELIAGKQLFFQRNNPDLIIKPEDITAINISESFVDKINSKDTLAEYIRSLHPITTESERGFIFNQLVGADIKMMQQFFYSFWKKRNSLNPESEWKKYKEQVVYTQKHFSTKIKKGYETDRGRVYLKYGPPNTIVDRPSEPGAYPYQFWHYYKTQIRGNSKFVFWNQDLVTNDYELLHSNVAGEVMNYRWQYMLSKRDNPNLNLDDPKGADRWGNWNDDFYDMPR